MSRLMSRHSGRPQQACSTHVLIGAFLRDKACIAWYDMKWRQVQSQRQNLFWPSLDLYSAICCDVTVFWCKGSRKFGIDAAAWHQDGLIDGLGNCQWASCPPVSWLLSSLSTAILFRLLQLLGRLPLKLL